jgi:hypothetical protein
MLMKILVNLLMIQLVHINKYLIKININKINKEDKHYLVKLVYVVNKV